MWRVQNGLIIYILKYKNVFLASLYLSCPILSKSEAIFTCMKFYFLITTILDLHEIIMFKIVRA